MDNGSIKATAFAEDRPGSAPKTKPNNKPTTKIVRASKLKSKGHAWLISVIKFVTPFVVYFQLLK